jgi:hypothetical protein
MTCALVVLACEAVRIRTAGSAGGLRASIAERTRTALAVMAAAAAIYGGAKLSPAIVALHEQGAIRGFGEDGARLESLHALAESIAKIEVSAGLILVVLQITTLRRGEGKTA